MNMRVLLLFAWVSLLPSAASATDLETSQIKCSEMGTKFSSRFKKEYTSVDSLWGNPEFHYSKASSTCLVYTEVTDGGLQKESNAVWYYRRVTDVYSNKVLAYSRYFVEKRDPTRKEILVNLGNVGGASNLSPTEFAKVKAELFSQ